MDAGTLQVFLRVLYTVNSNPQYILAKSSSQVQVITCDETTSQSATNEPTYARAPLKACLAAVCDSSPELLQDPARDFSLYFLDPLETQPLPTSLAHAPQHTSSPRGVAVALGLMSWALEASDSTNVFVTGTIIPNASMALEVVCALRETKRMPKPVLHSFPPSGPTSGSSHHHPSQIAGMNWLSTSHLQHDQHQQRTLTRSADFPEVYIGPPRRGRGRPEGSTSSKSKPKARASVRGASSSDVVETQSEFKQEVGRKSKQKTKSRPPRGPPTYSPFICTPLTRNIAPAAPGGGTTGMPISNQQSQPPNQKQIHNPLLELLSAISTYAGTTAANTTPEQQAALLSSLQGLLATNPHMLQLEATGAGTRIEDKTAQDVQDGNAGDEQDDGDSDIVILDSSTIDTTIFRKPSSTTNRESSQTPAPSGALELTSSATSGPETPTSMHVTSGWTGRGRRNASYALDIPITPTLFRTHKRKLDEYSQGQAHTSMPMSPPSPSPSVVRTSSPGSAFTAKHRIHSLPTGGNSSPLRLPSMLGSMRGMADHVGISDASSNGMMWNATAPKRRRTLTEFMAEHEARRNAKVRKPLSSRCKSSLPASAPQAASLRSANLGSTSRHARSSPPRPLFRSDSTCSALPFPDLTSQGIAVSNLAWSSTTSLTSMGSSTSALTVTQTKNPLKNFVVPAWARTGTATLPRLSDEVLARQRAEQETKKAQLSLRRREVAKAKRKQLRDANRPCKESSDEDDETVVNNAKRRTLQPSSLSVARSAPLQQPLLPSLPVFASDAVEPMPSSPPQSHLPLAPPVAPSTPPRKSSSVSGTHRTPNKSGSSLFTPSGQEPVSLFTPDTPSVTRSLTRVRFTPHSPTMFNRPRDSKKSPRKAILKTPCTPGRKNNDHRTSGSSHTDKNWTIASPSTATRTPQTQTGIGTRAFLLPPPSPCALRTPRRPSQAHSKVSAGSTSIALNDPGAQQQSPALSTQNAEGAMDRNEEDMFSRELEEALLEEDVTIPSEQYIPSRQDGRKSESCDTLGGEANPAEDDYASSPLPPSSPLPVSPFSSPAKRDDSGLDAQSIHDVAVPDSNVPLPSVSDSDGPQGATWFPGDANTPAAWLTDSDTNAWLTETEAWFTDTEGGGGGPLLTDSDGAWLSDSDAVWGDMSSLASNWPSDDADVDTDDGELGAVVGQGQEGGFDTDDFQRAYAALVEHGGRRDPLGDGTPGSSSDPAIHNHNLESDSKLFWEFMQPLLGNGGRGALNDDTATVPEVAQDDIQALLDGLVGT